MVHIETQRVKVLKANQKNAKSFCERLGSLLAGFRSLWKLWKETKANRGALRSFKNPDDDRLF